MTRAPRPAGLTLDDLRRTPNRLAPSYSRFRVAERLLLTGHSHQAWPDVAARGVDEALADAAELVDGKWARAEARAEELRAGVRRLLADPGADVALGSSTHDLLVRFLSALDLGRRPRLVATDGEFHSARRQLARLAEAGLEVVWVPAEPASTLAERLAAEVDGRTAAVVVSAVLFETARIVPGLDQLAVACRAQGAELVVDAYHALGVLPFELGEQGLADAHVLGGGYKYLQLGEGCCFLRLPPHAGVWRPVVTGWFAEPGPLAGPAPSEVAYGSGGDRFAGSTYDPVSHYRAAAVLAFHVEAGLEPRFLREVSRHQVGRLSRGVDDLDLDPAVLSRDRSVAPADRAGFLALRSPVAGTISAGLAERGVRTDHRGPWLRFGPAPYLDDAQLDAAVGALGEVVRGLPRS
ncbi:MAG: kynureninase [Acidimicrobiia bacterium]